MGLLESGLIKTIRIIGGRLNRAFTVIKNIIASERERELFRYGYFFNCSQFARLKNKRIRKVIKSILKSP